MDLLKRRERIPMPHVSISLDNHSTRPFRPGSRVSGTITLHSPAQRGLIHAEAIFFGRVVTHCTRIESQGTSIHRRALFSTNETAHYHDDACLFRLTQNLSDNADIEANRLCTWRFDFTFGHSAKLIGQSPYHGPTASSGIYTRGEHPLPPTFERYFNDHHYALVEYRLQAVFQFSEVPEPVTVHLPLNYFPTPGWPDPSKLSEYVRPSEHFSSRKLLDDHSSSKHSFGGRRSSDGPAVDVVIKASLNTQAIAGALAPIYICVEVHNPSSPSIAIPHIDVRIKSMTLHQVTIFRARQVNGWHGMPEYQEVGEDGTALHAAPEAIIVKPQVRDGGHGSFTFFATTVEARIPDTISPSFNTFNINNNYQMTLKIEADVCGKTFRHECNVESFIILPPS